MNIKKIFTVGMMAVMTGATLAATPQIKNVKAFQQYPWNAKVYISYEVVGDMKAGLPSDAHVRLLLTATDRVTGAHYEAPCRNSRASGPALSGDTGTSAGTHRVVWDLNAQELAFKSDAMVSSVAYEDGPFFYCVIDLSAGANASSYPVAYMDEPPSGGFNTDEYKTTKLVLRLIDPGSFKMNGKYDKMSGKYDEYDVTLTKPFYCGIFEVTQRQYELVTGSNPSAYKGDMRPVEWVSWNMIRGDSANWPSSANVDSSTFIGKLQARTGLNFDLPTEAQWEYACRAGTTSIYNNGGDSEDDLKLLGRYADNGGLTDYWDSTTQTMKTIYYGPVAVGSYQPNAWGLYDMHGNVKEWCLDFSGGDLSSGMTDPVGPSSGWYRRARGGGWYDRAYGCTSSYRDSGEPTYFNLGRDGKAYGFRLVRTLSE